MTFIRSITRNIYNQNKPKIINDNHLNSYSVSMKLNMVSAANY